MLLNPNADEVTKVIVEEGVQVVTTGAGNPEKIYGDVESSWCGKVIPVVASVAQAVRMERCGADAVVAEGCEAGGHIGESTTMVLCSPGSRCSFYSSYCSRWNSRRSWCSSSIYARCESCSGRNSFCCYRRVTGS